MPSSTSSSRGSIAGFSPLPPIKVLNKIRPSSAAANVQTHPSYSTGLFDNVARPSTAATNISGPSSAGPVRPHTQAGGSRSKWQSKPVEPKKEETVVRQPRRLTLGTVDGIADLDTIIRPGQIQSSIAYTSLKAKVSILQNISFIF